MNYDTTPVSKRKRNEKFAKRNKEPTSGSSKDKSNNDVTPRSKENLLLESPQFIIPPFQESPEFRVGWDDGFEQASKKINPINLSENKFGAKKTNMVTDVRRILRSQRVQEEKVITQNDNSHPDCEEFLQWAQSLLSSTLSDENVQGKEEELRNDSIKIENTMNNSQNSSYKINISNSTNDNFIIDAINSKSKQVNNIHKTPTVNIHKRKTIEFQETPVSGVQKTPSTPLNSSYNIHFSSTPSSSSSINNHSKNKLFSQKFNESFNLGDEMEINNKIKIKKSITPTKREEFLSKRVKLNKSLISDSKNSDNIESDTKHKNKTDIFVKPNDVIETNAIIKTTINNNYSSNNNNNNNNSFNNDNNNEYNDLFNDSVNELMIKCSQMVENNIQQNKTIKNDVIKVDSDCKKTVIENNFEKLNKSINNSLNLLDDSSNNAILECTQQVEYKLIEKNSNNKSKSNEINFVDRKSFIDSDISRSGHKHLLSPNNNKDCIEPSKKKRMCTSHQNNILNQVGMSNDNHDSPDFNLFLNEDEDMLKEFDVDEIVQSQMYSCGLPVEKINQPNTSNNIQLNKKILFEPIEIVEINSFNKSNQRNSKSFENQKNVKNKLPIETLKFNQPNQQKGTSYQVQHKIKNISNVLPSNTNKSIINNELVNTSNIINSTKLLQNNSKTFIEDVNVNKLQITKDFIKKIKEKTLMQQVVSNIENNNGNSKQNFKLVQENIGNINNSNDTLLKTGYKNNDHVNTKNKSIISKAGTSFGPTIEHIKRSDLSNNNVRSKDIIRNSVPLNVNTSSITPKYTQEQITLKKIEAKRRQACMKLKLKQKSFELLEH